MVDQRLGEGAVLARGPVERGALGIAGEGDQRAARQIAVDATEAALADDRTAPAMGEVGRASCRERVSNCV
jgi:hypothetical protein